MIPINGLNFLAFSFTMAYKVKCIKLVAVKYLRVSNIRRGADKQLFLAQTEVRAAELFPVWMVEGALVKKIPLLRAC